MSLGKTRRTAAFTLAISALAVLGIAQSAAAVTVSVDQPCYVISDDDGIFNAHFSASGLPPKESVAAKIEGSIRLGGEIFEGSPGGSLSGSVPGFFGSYDPVAAQGTLQIVGILSNTVYAETPVWVANFGMAVSTPHTNDGEKVNFVFAGLASGQPVHVHYVAHGKETFSRELGVTSGPCGTLEAKQEFYPARHSRFNSYLLQFDQAKKYSPRTQPRFRKGLETGKF